MDLSFVVKHFPDHDVVVVVVVVRLVVRLVVRVKTPWWIIPGWWFGTFFIFPYIGNHDPN